MITIPVWILLILIGITACLAWRKLSRFLAYVPDDPCRYHPWRTLFESLLRRTWDYLAVAGPNGQPLRLALVGAKYAEYLARFHRDRGTASPQVVALLKQENEDWPECWNLSPIPWSELNPSSVDAVLLMPFIDSFAVRRQLQQRYGRGLRILDLNRLTQFAIYFGAAVEKNSSLFSWTLEQYIRMTWNWLGATGANGTPLRLAVFGAGAHTQWLADITASGTLHAPKLVAVLDDKSTTAPDGWSAPVIKPESLNPADVDAILLSSDTVAEQMRIRCATLYGHKVRTIDLYEDLVPGPYFKL